ncbi:MAG: ABC transporter ATP-binding protein, partial [Vallitaleaceae bacterium]|nr:ABC transporter ATP-binding protein [Vallitaleaceae bacterium]
FLLVRSMKKGYPNFEKAQKALDKVNGRMREYLSGVRVVKAFNRFDDEVKRFEEVNQQLADTSMKSMQIMAIYMPLISLVVNLGIIAVLWIGGYGVRIGEFQLGKIIALVNYMTQILHALVMISNIFMMLVRTKTSAERVEEVLHHGISMEDAKEPMEQIGGSIEFQKVSFRYDGDESELALENISFRLEEGQTLGIIGSTGSGKSSLVNLISRFYDVSEGNILIGGIPIQRIPFQQLRDVVAFVPQKAVLFSGTIRENLQWGKADAKEEELRAACEIADAHEFIRSFPKSFDTLLGQGGVNVSGGQKQRISIARALLKEPKILILDDSTSAVDMTTDRKIRQGLKEKAKKMTVILVAQRISSLLDADRILVLEEGKM